MIILYDYSNLSSFEIRTYDSVGTIFFGNIGMDNWFLLGIRDGRLEVQMSNGNGQMVFSKWGPEVSNGKWQKVRASEFHCRSVINIGNNNFECSCVLIAPSYCKSNDICR